MTLPDMDKDLSTYTEEEARQLGDHHRAIEALGSIVEVVTYADRVKVSGHPGFMQDELLHHLERRRVQLLRKQGAFVP